MDKLFHAPKSTPNRSSSSGVQLYGGQKNPKTLVDPKTTGNTIDPADGFQHSFPAASSQAPLCRPWDRGDLMRRIATFKSMTWFGKPKVVSAVNCARRGWVNVDMDILACESCGARLLFSTPSSWTQQQVEKAALVFTLKLDSGHKLLCPWNDNACDETLAQFPPTTPADLVDNFRERSSALLQLSSLPVISSSAIEHMRSPQLEAFLRRPSTMEYANGSAEVCQIESSANEIESDSFNLYYQAQKLISLCGWEPRSLPYVVDFQDGANHVVKDANILQSSPVVAHGQNSIISIINGSNGESMEANESSGAHMTQSDPKSVVLDCRLCGASVGLWAFSTVSQPVELFRLVGYTEVNGENNYGTHDVGNKNVAVNRDGLPNTSSDSAPSQNESLPNLNRTIAGGPPPTKQKFKATISLPVIGQNLRAKFSSDFDIRDHLCSNQETHSGSKNKNILQEEKDSTEHNRGGQVLLALKCKRDTEEHFICASDDQDHGLTDGISGEDDAVRKESTSNSVEGCFLSENVENIGSVSSIGKYYEDKDTPVNITDVSTLTGPGENSNNDLPSMVTSDNCSQQQSPGMDVEQGKETPSANHQESSCIASCLEAHASVNVSNTLAVRVDKEVVAVSGEKDLKQLPASQAMKFDPIKQHRHFCPWIIPTGSGLPGWQRTLSALQCQKVHSHPSPTGSPPSGSIIKVDDPIYSIRKLFMSPPAKRMKSSGVDQPKLPGGAN